MSITTFLYRGFVLSVLFVALLGCSVAPGYSPGLGLGVDQPKHRNTRLSFAAEAAPNALSTRPNGPQLTFTSSFRYERALSDNTTVRARLILGQGVHEEEPRQEGGYLGLGLAATFRYHLAAATDLVVVPRVQSVRSDLFGDSGLGGGVALVVRHRLAPDCAIYAGPAAYFGRASGTTIVRNGQEGFTPRGHALGGHFGLSLDASRETQLNLEITPLRQSDNFFDRSVWLPAFQISYTGELTGRTKAERRERRRRRRAARAY